MLFKVFVYFPEEDSRGEIATFIDLPERPADESVITVDTPNGNRFTCRVERVAETGPNDRHAGVIHCRALEVPNLLDEIREELFRIRADAGSVGQRDAIRVNDRGGGYAQLDGSPVAPPFSWFGPAAEILERLSSLPDGSGPEAIRSEFHE